MSLTYIERLHIFHNQAHLSQVKGILFTITLLYDLLGPDIFTDFVIHFSLVV